MTLVYNVQARQGNAEVRTSMSTLVRRSLFIAPQTQYNSSLQISFSVSDRQCYYSCKETAC